MINPARLHLYRATEQRRRRLDCMAWWRISPCSRNRCTTFETEQNEPQYCSRASCSSYETVELKCHLLESLWHRDAIAKRSAGRGTEIIRQFRRLGAGWANVAVFETWGDLFFEAYDPAVTCTLTLQVTVDDASNTHTH